MTFNVFYSWQSDLPKKWNMNLIEEALSAACKTLASDAEVLVTPVVDRDTKGVIGALKIDEVIFGKIDVCHVFVADVSIINSHDSGSDRFRPTPNPNVLVESGYAAKAVTWRNLILVFNTEYGQVEELPFDMRQRMMIQYSAKAGDSPADKRNHLRKGFEKILRELISTSEVEPTKTIWDEAFTAVEANQIDKLERIRIAVGSATRAFQDIEPAIHGVIEDSKRIVSAFKSAQATVSQVARLLKVSIVRNDHEALDESLEVLQQIVERYENPRTFSGEFYEQKFDFWKLLGREVFTIAVALMLSTRRWELLQTVLKKNFRIPALQDKNRSPMVDLVTVGKLPLVVPVNPIDGPSIAKLYREALDGESMQPILSYQDFASADFYLGIAGQLRVIESGQSVQWGTVTILEDAPRFLVAGNNAQFAEKVRFSLDAPSINWVAAAAVQVRNSASMILPVPETLLSSVEHFAKG